MAPIKFGTDGWRGVIADDFTFANVRRVAQATADYWNSVGRASSLPTDDARASKMLALRTAAMVGYDNRFLSETYAKLVCEVLAGNGIKALYAPAAMPTPAVTHAVRDRHLCGAVMITASHNPPEFNGYKVKADYAGPADPKLCARIEKHLDRSKVRLRNFDGAVKQGLIEIYDPRPAHLRSIKSLVDLKTIRQANLRVVIDSMHGSGGDVLRNLLGPTNRRVTGIRATRDVFFGGTNPEPITKNLRPLCTAVKRMRAHVGVATDGDADRVGVVDDRSRYVSIQLVFALLLLHLIRNRGEREGVVVKSSNSTVLIDRICRAHGLKFAEVPVGFKYICEKMRSTDVLIGGEESGGIGFRGHIPERDGILANLMLLELLAVTGESISRLVRDVQKEFGASVYDRIDLPYPLGKRDRLIERLRRNPPRDLLGSRLANLKTFDGVKYIAGDDSWLMFRTSGTEPIVRIYSEASSTRRVRHLLALGREFVLSSPV